MLTLCLATQSIDSLHKHCSGDLHVAGDLTKNPEEGKVKVTSTTEGDINASNEWFKGGRAGPSVLFVSASKQGDYRHNAAIPGGPSPSQSLNSGASHCKQ